MTKSIGGPGPNIQANLLAQKNAQDARLLAKDSAKGANLNATTIARQSNPQADTKKAADNAAPKPPVRETPKESFVSSASGETRTPAETPTRQSETRGAESETSVRGEAQASPKSEAQVQSDTSKSAEALGNFSQSLFGLQGGNEKDFEAIMTEAASIDTSQLPGLGKSGQEVALASVALRTAVGKLQAKMPNATPEQIREAAKNDPEIAKWASIADSSQNYLNEFRAENPGVVNAAASQAAAAAAAGAGAVPGGDPLAAAGAAVPGAAVPGASGATEAAQKMNQQMQEWNGLQRMSAETQAQMVADNMKTMESIKTIYQQMWAEMQKARAERHKLVMDTANHINSLAMESHVNRARTSQKMFTDMLNTITGNYR